MDQQNSANQVAAEDILTKADAVADLPLTDAQAATAKGGGETITTRHDYPRQVSLHR